MPSPPWEPVLSATRFADLLAGYCLDVRAGQQVLVRSTSLAAPLLLELQRAILEREAWPLLRVELPGQAEGFYGHARDAQLDGFPSLALRAFQAALIERLRTARGLRIEAEGTDLTLRVEGRTWVNSDGQRNMPSGEVFTGPHEDSANGRIRFDVPSSPAGVDVAGVELVF